MSADEHLAELDEVTMLLVVNLNNTPWVTASADLATIRAGDLGRGSNDSERNLGEDLIVLGDSLIIVKLVAWSLKDLDVMELDICEDLVAVSFSSFYGVVGNILLP